VTPAVLPPAWAGVAVLLIAAPWMGSQMAR
jgi:hypothetical protein